MQEPDTAPGPYYVSVMRDGSPLLREQSIRLLSGPYLRHEEALALVNKAQHIAEALDPKAVWYSYGTVRMSETFNKPGILQKLGYDLLLQAKSDEVTLKYDHP